MSQESNGKIQVTLRHLDGKECVIHQGIVSGVPGSEDSSKLRPFDQRIIKWKNIPTRYQEKGHLFEIMAGCP